MPKILSYTPSWLTRPSPGYALFSQKPKEINAEAKEQKQGGQDLRIRRTIAHRGTEIFVVVDNEIRWSDLVMLRERSEEDQQDVRLSDIARSQHSEGVYRVMLVYMCFRHQRSRKLTSRDFLRPVTSGSPCAHFRQD